MKASTRVDVIVVGAGFAGMYALHHLRDLGFSVQVLEIAPGVGGTWYWNRYPGARCDVHSLEYSYQFSEQLQQEWNWSERYAPQAEILAYANHVAERFALNQHIQFNTRVLSMHFDEKSATWRLTTNRHEQWTSKYCVMATGCLSKPNRPKISGLDKFAGPVLHTGEWPESAPDFSNQRVGIVGTGSSAIQLIPILAEQAHNLTVFQRTASFSIPAHNGKMDRDYEQTIKTNYVEFRAQNSQRFAALNNNPNSQSALEIDPLQRQEIYESRWRAGGLPFLASFNDLGTNPIANQTAVDFVHQKIRQLVQDPQTAELLCPKTVLGCKRLCVDTDYYQTFNRDNVKLVDISQTPISRVSAAGVEKDPEFYQLDTLILATGFDAMTGALLNIDIRGRRGLSLRQKWHSGPSNYLGLAVHGFPNLFIVTGPGSPSVLANMMVAIEQHVNWIGQCLRSLRTRGLSSIEASADAEQEWVAHVNEVASRTLYPTGCNSWYTGANIPGKPRIFMPYLGYPAYVARCEEVAAADYRGFCLEKPAAG